MKITWDFNSDYSLEDLNFSKIYNFFVIQTPIHGISKREISFKKRKWNMNSLNSNLKKIPVFKDSWFCERPKSDNLKKLFTTNKLDKYSYNFINEIVINTTYDDGETSGNTTGLFYAIRCGFAHGAFMTFKFKNDIYYCFENRDKDKLKARIILKEMTLLSIIELVNTKQK